MVDDITLPPPPRHGGHSITAELGNLETILFPQAAGPALHNPTRLR